MPEDPGAAPDLASLADRVRSVLTSGDPDGFRDLFSADARWGAADGPDDDGCRNRDQITGWWARARAGGVRAAVTEVTAGTGALLVGLDVTGRPDDGDGASRRWQVLTVRDGRVCDIRGFDNRPEAVARAGLASR